MVSFQIKFAQPQDTLKISHILVTSFYSRCPGWLKPLILWSISLDLGSRLLDQGAYYACLVALADGEAIATVEVNVKTLGGLKNQPYISNLAVHSNWRRRRVASQLLTMVEAKVRTWGFKYIYLHVLDTNQGALHLYELLGYKIYRADPELHLNPFDSSVRLLLRKCL